MAVLVLGLVAVFVWLPTFVQQNEAPPETLATASPRPADTQANEASTDATSDREPRIAFDPDNPEHINARRDAQDLKRELDSAIETLSTQAVEQWAPAEFDRLNETMDLAEAAYRELAFVDAREGYRRAKQIVESIEQQAQEAVTQALAQAERFLNLGDQAAATERYQLALTIEPGNAKATDGLQRANKLPELMAHIEAAREAEVVGDTTAAIGHYERALEVDPASTLATERIQTLRAEQTAVEFKQAMSDGYAALDKGQLTTATQRFRRAAKIDPNSSEASEALRHVASVVRNQKIAQLNSRIAAAEEAEDWPQAITLYDELKAMGAGDSRTDAGRKDAQRQQSLMTQLEKQISAPDRLASDAVYKSAEALLAEVDNITPRGAKLTSRADVLRQWMTAMRTPRRLRLTSDGLTSVTIYKVAQFGTLTAKEIEIFPGRYVAVGSRAGFRDVRKEFRVDPNTAQTQLDVRCDQPIVAAR